MIAALRKLGSALWRSEHIVFGRWEMVVMRVLFALVMFDAGSKLTVCSLHFGAKSCEEGFKPALEEYYNSFSKLIPSSLDLPTLKQWAAQTFERSRNEISVIPPVSDFEDQPKPHGIAAALDNLDLTLTFLHQARPAGVIHIGFLIALIFYALGVALPVSLGWMFFALLLHGTYHNSQGSIHHHLQLITCVVGAQWIASVLAVARRGGVRQWLQLAPAAENRLVNWTQQVIAAGYVVSALSKLVISKGQWMWDTPRFGIQLAKAVDQDYYDHLRAGTDTPAWLPDWLLEHPWQARLLFGPALPLEFFAFLALRNRALGALYAIALIAFHLSVSALMSLDFRYNVQMMIVYLVNVPFWLWWWAKGRKAVA
jgi:hypothetical protein